MRQQRSSQGFNIVEILAIPVVMLIVIAILGSVWGVTHPNSDAPISLQVQDFSGKMLVFTKEPTEAIIGPADFISGGWHSAYLISPDLVDRPVIFCSGSADIPKTIVPGKYTVFFYGGTNVDRTKAIAVWHIVVVVGAKK